MANLPNGSSRGVTRGDATENTSTTRSGGGSLTATFEKGGLTDNTYLKVDGTINF